MTKNLLVLQFVEEGKLTVDDAVELFATLAEEAEGQEFVVEKVPAPVTVWIIQGNELF